ENGFAIGIVTGSTGPPTHLFDFHHRNRSEPHVHVEPVEVPDHDSSRRGVDSLREGRGRDDAFDAPPLEFLLDEAPLVVCESGVMEGYAPVDALAEAGGHRGGLLL